MKSVILRHSDDCAWIGLLTLLALAAPPARTAAGLADDGLGQAPQAAAGAATEPRRVFRDRVTPHWYADNSRFWYRNDLHGGAKEFVAVDAERGLREPAFDHARLAEGLGRAAGSQYRGDQLPFELIEFVSGTKSIRFQIGDAAWECDLASYQCAKTSAKVAGSETETSDESSGLATRRRGRGGDPGGTGVASSGQSPDGKWTAFVRDSNLFLRSRGDGTEVQLSQDGKAGEAYGQIAWAPDSQTVVAFRLAPGERKEVYLFQSSPPGGGRAKMQSRPYALPGDKFPTYEINLFRVASRQQIKPKVDRFEHEWLQPRPHWSRDGRHCRYEQADRGHQRFRVIDVEAETGKVRNLIDERSQTFIWTAHTENVRLSLVNWLAQSEEIIWASESNGWRQLYLIDAQAGKLKNPITHGPWVVRGIDRIDETNRQVWFQASGVFPDQDPYLIHYGRVNFDGTGQVFLTTGNGIHSVQYSPGRKYLIDTYSRADRPPVNELRRASDGSLLGRLEEADITDLKASGWEAPEVFVAKGRDHKTDIWGIICRPRNLDPKRKYPLIEDIYAGPQGSFVLKTFSPVSRYDSLNRLGFIVVKIDGMGTANRSKAFHDVCWHNLKDAGFEDRILWMKAAAAKYPYLDVSRVGVFGTSAGGQNAAAAVLFHPEFYQAAVANSGCHDNRMDKASWNEQWMGYPVGPQYQECSNIDNASRLRGHLFLIVGEMDNNVPPESTYRFTDALIKANKDFDFLLVPNGGHGAGGAYAARRRDDFFVRHLLRQDPPNRNAAIQAAVAQIPGVPAVSTPPESFFELVSTRDREVARQFYKKHLDVKGMPVVASAEVADLALQRTYDIVTHLLAGRPDVLAAMVKDRMYLIVIGKDQLYTDMPEYSHSRNPAYQNERVRGTGGRPTSFGEENLLSLPLDRYDDESIGVHEFCHTIDSALRSIDSTWSERRNAAYRNAINLGLWKNAYAGSNPGEYWAEICQSYFDCNRINNWNHTPIGTREQLLVYDPKGYELVRTTFNLSAGQEWRYHWLQKLPNVTSPPAKFKIDPYYTKFTWAREFTVLGCQASDAALLKANDTIRKMFAYRHDILKALIADGVKLAVLGRQERITDLPEYKDRAIDALARRLDYSPQTKLLVVAEENVLADPSAPLVGASQVIGVFAKALYYVTGTRPVDPNWENRGREVQQYELRVKRLDLRFDTRLKAAFDQAVSNGLWKGTAAIHDRVAYWSEGVLAYFDALGQEAAPNDAPHPINTREALRAYDPDLYALVNETMAYDGHVDWRLKP